MAAIEEGGRVFGILADAPAQWENRCLVLIDPDGQKLAVMNGDGREAYPFVLRPLERIEFEPSLLERCAVVATDSIPQSERFSGELRSYFGEIGSEGWQSLKMTQGTLGAHGTTAVLHRRQSARAPFRSRTSARPLEGGPAGPRRTLLRDFRRR